MVADPVSVRLLPLQRLVDEAVAVTDVGVVLTTVTVTVAVLLQDKVLVPVTVYVVVTVGEAETLEPVVAERPVDGDHE